MGDPLTGVHPDLECSVSSALSITLLGDGLAFPFWRRHALPHVLNHGCCVKDIAVEGAHGEGSVSYCFAVQWFRATCDTWVGVRSFCARVEPRLYFAMLINLSNHPLAKWSSEQREEAEQQFGSVVDLQFPPIAPSASLNEVVCITSEYVQKCRSIFANSQTDKPNAIHLMGEFTFTYQFLKQMEALGIHCVASMTERIVTEDPEDPTKKTTVFKFLQFRPYFMTPTRNQT
jgi:hypothetical protein